MGERDDGNVHVLVVNHMQERDAVEYFVWDRSSEIQYVRSFEDESFISVNDISWVDERTFVASNDHGSGRKKHFNRLLETFIPRIFSAASVVLVECDSADQFRDGGNFTVTFISEGSRVANGLVYEAASETLVIAESLAQRLHIGALARGG